MREAHERELRPYGHHLADGLVQLCFTLPVKCNAEAQQAAVAYAQKLGIVDSRVTWMEAMGEDFTYFILYGKAQPVLNRAELKGLVGDLPRVAEKPCDVDKEFRQRLGRRAVILTCTDGMGSGEIDFEAMTSLKGISGEIGLEGYSTFSVKRFRGPDSVDAIVDAAQKSKADALLVCEPTRGWGKGEKALKDLAKKISKNKDLPAWFVLACWRRDPAHAGEGVAGYQLSFGRGIQPSRVADQLVSALDKGGLGTGGGSSRNEPQESSGKKRRLWGILGRNK